MADLNPDLSMLLDGPLQEVDVRTPYGLMSRCPRPVNRNRSSRESPVWELGKTYSLNERPGHIRAWRCNECKEFVSLYKGLPSIADKHLQQKHGIFINDRSQQTASSDIASNTGSQAESVQTRPNQPLISSIFAQPRYDIKLWRRDVLKLLIAGHLPFHLVDTQEWKDLMISVNTALSEYTVSTSAARQSVLTASRLKLACRP